MRILNAEDFKKYDNQIKNISNIHKLSDKITKQNSLSLEVVNEFNSTVQKIANY